MARRKCTLLYIYSRDGAIVRIYDIAVANCDHTYLVREESYNRESRDHTYIHTYAQDHQEDDADRIRVIRRVGQDCCVGAA